MGLLRIAAPNDYGSCTLAPLAAAFSKQFPACRVDLMLADTKIDLVANQIDLSIRVGWLEDSNLQGIVSFRQLLVAAPGVVKKRAVAQPSDLASLPFVANGALREPLQWQFTGNDFERQTVRMTQTLTINTTPAVMAATLAVLPDFLVMEDVKAGRLMHSLPSWTLPAGGIHAVYPAARFRPPKVTAFVALLMEQHKHTRQGNHVGSDRRSDASSAHSRTCESRGDAVCRADRSPPGPREGAAPDERDSARVEMTGCGVIRR